MKHRNVSKRVIGAIMTVMVAASVLSGCSGKDATDAQAGNSAREESGTAVESEVQETDLPVLRVAVQPYLNGASNYYMMEEGLDVQNGFKIETQQYENGTLINEALGADLWDIGYGGPSAVFGIANFGAMVIGDIDLCSGGASAFVRPDSDIASVKDELGTDIYGNAETLKGAQVLCPIGTLNQYNVMAWIEMAGLTQNDVEFVHMDNSSAFQAFKAGQGDIMACSPPLTYTSEEEGWTVGASCTDLGLEVWDPLLANPDSLEDPEVNETICKYVKVLYETFDMFMSDPDLFAEWYVKYQKASGNEITFDQARQEVEARPFITTDTIHDREVGETIYNTAVFFNQVETLEDADLEKIQPNLTNEIIDKVFPQ